MMHQHIAVIICISSFDHEQRAAMQVDVFHVLFDGFAYFCATVLAVAGAPSRQTYCSQEQATLLYVHLQMLICSRCSWFRTTVPLITSMCVLVCSKLEELPAWKALEAHYKAVSVPPLFPCRIAALVCVRRSACYCQAAQLPYWCVELCSFSFWSEDLWVCSCTPQQADVASVAALLLSHARVCSARSVAVSACGCRLERRCR